MRQLNLRPVLVWEMANPLKSDAAPSRLASPSSCSVMLKLPPTWKMLTGS